MKDNFSAFEIEKDKEDFKEALNDLPKKASSSLTNTDIIIILQFLTNEICRLNNKVWNLIEIVRKNNQGLKEENE